MAIKDPKVLALQFGLGVLKLIEAFMPAFFVAWNQWLHAKNSQMDAKLKATEAELEIAKSEVAIDEKYRDKDRRTLLEYFLRRAKPSPRDDHEAP